MPWRSGDRPRPAAAAVRAELALPVDSGLGAGRPRDGRRPVGQGDRRATRLVRAHGAHLLAAGARPPALERPSPADDPAARRAGLISLQRERSASEPLGGSVTVGSPVQIRHRQEGHRQQRAVDQAEQAEGGESAQDAEEDQQVVHAGLRADQLGLDDVLQDQRLNQAEDPEGHARGDLPGQDQEQRGGDHHQSDADDGQERKQGHQGAPQDGRGQPGEPHRGAAEHALQQAGHAVAQQNSPGDSDEFLDQQLFFVVGEGGEIKDETLEPRAIHQEVQHEHDHDGEVHQDRHAAVEGERRLIDDQIPDVARRLEGELSDVLVRDGNTERVEGRPATREQGAQVSGRRQELFGGAEGCDRLGCEGVADHRHGDRDHDDDPRGGERRGDPAPPTQAAFEPRIGRVEQRHQHEGANNIGQEGLQRVAEADDGGDEEDEEPGRRERLVVADGRRRN